MGIQAQIDRIKNNVTRSLAKVAEKGVTVPADANSDDLEGLIDAIEAGGGSGGGGSAMQIATGTFISADGKSPITISGLGFAPKSLIVYLAVPDGVTAYFPKSKSTLVALSMGELLDNRFTVVNVSTMTTVRNTNESYSVQLTQDGFILSILDTSFGFAPMQHNYIALG